MGIKKTGKMAILVAASAALVATLINDRKPKEQQENQNDK